MLTVLFVWSPDLNNMYKLLKPIHSGLGVLIHEVENHIRQSGLEAVKNLKGDNVSLLGNMKKLNIDIENMFIFFFYCNTRTRLYLNFVGAK